MLSGFSFNDAYRVIKNVVDERISSLTRSGAGIEYTWGTVAGIGTPPNTCSVYILDDPVPSSGFRLENGMEVNYLDPVRVAIDKRGNRWVDGVLNPTTGGVIDPRNRSFSVDRIRIPNVTADAALASVNHPIQVGPTNGQNLVMDDNEIMSRNNGAISTLYLQETGGQVNVGGQLLVNVVGDAALGSTGHGLQVGGTAGANLILDTNEVMARDNGATAPLFLNNEGGAVYLSGFPRLRYVTATGSTYNVYNAATFGADTAQNVSIASIPAGANPRLIIGHLIVSQATAPNGNVRIFDYGPAHQVAVAYPQVTGKFNSTFFAVKPGGTGGSQIYMQWTLGGGGTITTYMTVHGYFVDDA